MGSSSSKPSRSRKRQQAHQAPRPKIPARSNAIKRAPPHKFPAHIPTPHHDARPRIPARSQAIFTDPSRPRPLAHKLPSHVPAPLPPARQRAQPGRSRGNKSDTLYFTDNKPQNRRMQAGGYGTFQAGGGTAHKSDKLYFADNTPASWGMPQKTAGQKRVDEAIRRAAEEGRRKNRMMKERRL